MKSIIIQVNGKSGVAGFESLAHGIARDQLRVKEIR